MARQFAPRHFLRIAPNASLAAYFQYAGVLEHISFENRAETEIDDIYEAWQALPTAQRTQLDADFTQIDSLATDEGIATLHEEAQFLHVLLGDSSENSLHDKVFSAFLQHRDLFDRVWQIVNAVDRPGKYWSRRNDLPEVRARTDANTLATLASALRFYYTQSEGRGQVCVVEPCERESITYFFCYLADRGRVEMEFDDHDRLAREPSRRAFEVIFMVSPTRNALEIFQEGSARTTKALETIFARIVFGFDLPQRRDETVYELNAFKDRNFQFLYDPNLGITGVSIKKLRFTALGGIKRRATLEADPSFDRAAIHDFMEALFQTSGSALDGGRLPLAAFNITLAQLQVKFEPIPRRRRPTKTFQITFPNGCSLLHEGQDGAIREMLWRSGIERRPDQN